MRLRDTVASRGEERSARITTAKTEDLRLAWMPKANHVTFCGAGLPDQSQPDRERNRRFRQISAKLKNGSVQESVRAPILVGLGLVAFSSPPPSSLWKCGNPRLVRVSKLGGTGNNLRLRFRYRSHRASFPQRTRNSAHFGANVVVAAAQNQNVRFQKPAQNEHFYRLSCRALKTSDKLRRPQ